MKKIETDYNNAVEVYLKKFEEISGMDFDWWVGDRIGEVAGFAEYFFQFSDIKYLVDFSIKIDYLLEWSDFSVEFSKCYYNFESYCKLRRDAEKNEYFELDNFEKNLLYLRIEK